MYQIMSSVVHSYDISILQIKKILCNKLMINCEINRY